MGQNGYDKEMKIANQDTQNNGSPMMVVWVANGMVLEALLATNNI
jgi:hypothetical protein